MNAAYNTACVVLGLASVSDSFTRVLADRIIAAAKAGQRDPDRMFELAIAGFKAGGADNPAE